MDGNFVLFAGWLLTLLAGAGSGWLVYAIKNRKKEVVEAAEQGALLKTLEERMDRHEDGCTDRTKTIHDRISNVRRELGEDISKIDDKLGDLVVGQARIYGRLEALGKTEGTQ